MQSYSFPRSKEFRSHRDAQAKIAVQRTNFPTNWKGASELAQRFHQTLHCQVWENLGGKKVPQKPLKKPLGIKLKINLKIRNIIHIGTYRSSSKWLRIKLIKGLAEKITPTQDRGAPSSSLPMPQ